jgi:hypothetical protein
LPAPIGHPAGSAGNQLKLAKQAPLITWIYYSSLIFFYGSLFTHEYAQRLGSHGGRPQQQEPAH